MLVPSLAWQKIGFRFEEKLKKRESVFSSDLFEVVEAAADAAVRDAEALRGAGERDLGRVSRDAA